VIRMLLAFMFFGCMVSGPLIDGDRRADGVAGTPSIGTAYIGKVDPVDGDAGDLHGQTTMFPVWVLAMKARCAS